MKTSSRTVSGWGRFQPAPVTHLLVDSANELAKGELPDERVIARGLGRSYGDAAQRQGGNTVVTTNCVNVEWVDRSDGLVRVDAGVSIGQLIDQFVPKGWFVPVSPGTRHVTVGGAIAADIHGKNHHLDGSFGDHVISLGLRLATDDRLVVSPSIEPDIFWATVGGMGLTGIIVDAVLQLTPIPTSTIAVETQRLHTIDELVAEMVQSDQSHAFSVAWVDLLGRGRSVLTQGSFASPEQKVSLTPVPDPSGVHQRPPNPSIGLPAAPLPRLATTPAVRAFNELWWRKAPAELTTTAESITSFFHPLDAISNWNRVYGSTGFVQWQCVVPEDQTLFALIERFRSLPAFFTVLKRLGAPNRSPLSFPITGWTLAVDLPATTSVLSRLGELDAVVADGGGRIYLAKDALLRREHFDAMYERADQFRATRKLIDPTGRFESDLSVRLGL